jgi:hypothetical protein
VHVFFQICCLSVSFFATCVFWLQMFIYVCVEACCYVVYNLVLVWFVCGYFVNWSVQDFSFLSILFYFLALRLEAIDKVDKQNSLIIIKHRQNPTGVIHWWYLRLYFKFKILHYILFSKLMITVVVKIVR